MKITIFCGASNGNNPIYSQRTVELGEWMIKNNHDLVYGGGKVGLMGVIADTIINNGKAKFMTIGSLAISSQ